MSSTDKFLTAYKVLEGVLRERGFTIKEYEDENARIGDAASKRVEERLRMCRIVRNYMSHVDDSGFMEPTAKMIGFLEGEARCLRELEDVVKKHLKRPEACLLKCGMTCEFALGMFAKLGCLKLPVLMPNGTYKTANLFHVLKSGRLEKISVAAKTDKEIVFCGPLDLYADQDPSKMVLCTDDGTKTGKLLGRVWFTDVQM